MMMRESALLGVSLLLLGPFAAARNVIFESLYSAPDGWQRVKEANPSSLLHLRIALEQPNISNGVFERTLYQISSPDHPSYGQHLSREEVKELVKPLQGSTDVVLAWLNASGISNSDIEDAGDWINFKTTVAQAEKLLDADFGVYNYAGTDVAMIRTLNYSVPAGIQSHITMVQPTTVFSRIQRHKSQIFRVEESSLAYEAAASMNQTDFEKLCNYYITPACLRILYKVGNWTAAPAAKTMVGVSGFLNVSSRRMR